MSNTPNNLSGKSDFPLDSEIPKWADNATQLAAILKHHLGVGTRQTIRNWKRDYPDACPSARPNGKYLVSEWIDFAGEIAAEKSQGELSEKTKLENEKLREQIARMRSRREREDGFWTHNSLIGDEVRRLVAEAVAVLRDELETKAPSEHRERNRAALDKAMSRLHRGAEDIAQKFAAPDARTPIIEEEGIVVPAGE